MATLYLIRHGQASFGAQNYDQLSKTGHAQGRVLGQWLARHVHPDAVFCGSMQRHQQTLAAMAEGAEADWSGITTIEPGVNEFDHLAVMHAWRPQWRDRAVMASELMASGNPTKTFQQAFVAAVERWAGGMHDGDYGEPWAEFQARVWASMESVIARAAGARHVFVVTSGGPITVVVQRLLGLDDHKALGLNEMLANAGVSRVLFSGERRSLAVFNSFAHLEGENPALVTYR